jgi:hypothetical protein
MVNLWWIAVHNVVLIATFSGSKNMPLFRIYFCGIPILGIPFVCLRRETEDLVAGGEAEG